MSDTRKLTVGVTIDLGNGENLRLEVSDTAATASDAAELRNYLAEVLDGYGEHDSSARQAIEEYRRTVLAPAGGSGEDETSDMFFPAVSDEEACVPASFNPDNDPSFDDHAPESREDLAETDYMRLPPAPLVDEQTEEFVCSKCGAAVGKRQRDVSLLFNHRILCEDCMKQHHE